MRNKKKLQKRFSPTSISMGKGIYAMLQNKSNQLLAKQPLAMQQQAVQYLTAATKYLQ
jgi:hypothetical protein